MEPLNCAPVSHLIPHSQTSAKFYVKRPAHREKDKGQRFIRWHLVRRFNEISDNKYSGKKEKD